MRLSVSALRTHSECPARWRMRWIDKIPAQDADSPPWIKAGVVVHAGLEAAYKSARASGHVGAMHTPELLATAMEGLTAKADELGVPVAERADLAEQVIDYLIEQRVDASRILGVEEFSNLVLSRKDETPDGSWLQVIAIADRIEKGAEGIVVTDYKASNSKAEFDPREDMQTKITMLVLANRFGWAQAFTFRWEFTRSRDSAQITRTRAEVDLLGRSMLPDLRARADIMRAGPWPHQPGTWCRTCPYTTLCPVAPV